MRTVVFRTGHLGDTVCAIPAFRRIRACYPHSELILLCDDAGREKVSAVEVVRKLGIFDQIHSYRSGSRLSTLWQMWRAARKLAPQRLIALPQANEPAASLRQKRVFFRLAGIPEVLGFSKYPVSGWQPTEADRLLQLLDNEGFAGEAARYAIPVDEVIRLRVQGQLQALGIPSENRFLVFCGGGKAPTQRWPLERYGEVLRKVHQQTGWPILAIGSDSERAQFRQVLASRVPGLMIWESSGPIAELFELLRIATAYFGNDTGPMHVAAAVDCPVAVVMSARNFAGAWDPDVEPRLVLRNRLECEGCFLEDCVEKQHRCLQDISAQQVADALLPFLESLPTHSAKRPSKGTKEEI